jgi:hypothetical protein
MRETLKKLNNKRLKFYADFVRYGTKSSFRGAPKITLLFSNIRDEKMNPMCDHIWFTTNKQFEFFNFSEGDIVSFEARVKKYKKGYRGRREDVDNPPAIDYRLSNPTKIIQHTYLSDELTLF